MTLQTDIDTAAAQVLADSLKLKDIVNGDAATVVVVDSGPVKSVAKAIADIGDTSNQAVKDLSNVLDADFSSKAASAGVGGNMDGANNLAELTNTSTAQSNLGLGPAAVENVAVGGVGNLLRADGDGSSLTGIITTDNTARANIVLNAFRIAVNGGLSVQNMVDGVVDEFGDETGVDTITSTNQTYDAAGDYYGPAKPDVDHVTSACSILLAVGAIYGTYLITDLMDGSTATYVMYTNGFATHRTEVTLVSAASIHQIRLYLNSNDANRHVGTRVYTYDGTSWTQRGSEGINNTVGWHTFNFTAVAGVVGVAFEFDQGGGAGLSWGEIEAYGPGAAQNMILVSNANTALSQPANAFIVLWQQDVEAVTLNTDLKASASRDGGATWTQVTLSEQAVLATGRILTGSVDISARPAGTSIKWKIETLNNKEQRIHGVGLEWS